MSLVAQIYESAANAGLLKAKGDALCVTCHPVAKVDAQHTKTKRQGLECLDCHSPHASAKPHETRTLVRQDFMAAAGSPSSLASPCKTARRCLHSESFPACVRPNRQEQSATTLPCSVPRRTR